MRTFRGSCLCGSYRFSVEGPIIFLKNCHCSRCRKMSGSSFATYARAYTKDLRVSSGGEWLDTYERAPGNVIAFCKRCASLVPYPPPGSPSFEFGAGLLDDDPGVDVAYHIYVGSRAPWCKVQDGLRFDEMGGLSEEQVRALPAARRQATAPKPSHLGPAFGAQFADASVVRAYATRPPYPPALFAQLSSLVARRPARVLELGCGSGDVSCGLAGQVEQLDAIDPSEPMLACARARAQRSNSIRFIQTSAESFEPTELYDLAVAAESLHWMDWQVVLPKLARSLVPGAVLAIVTPRRFRELSWSSALAPLIARYSTNRAYEAYDLVQELVGRGLFREHGRCSFQAPFSQSVEDYVESFHSRNGFSRERMDVGEAAAFDEAVRELVLSHAPNGIVSGDVGATVVWGTPCGGRS